MLASLGRLAGAALKYYIVGQVVQAGGITPQRIRRSLGGVLLLFVTMALGVVGAAFLLTGLFLHLAELPQYVSAALLVGVITLLIATLGFFEGLRLLKRY